MYTLTAQHGTTHSHHESALMTGFAQQRAWLMEPPADENGCMKTTTTSSTVYNGHLGVLRQEDPTLERQRRYDFWFKQA